MANRRRRWEDDDDDDQPRRRSRRQQSQAGMWWIVGGIGGAMAVVLIIVLVVVLGRNPADGQPGPGILNPLAQNPAGQNDGGEHVAMRAPLDGLPLKGEQIYQKLLLSTAYIEATVKAPAGIVQANPNPVVPAPQQGPPFAKKIGGPKGLPGMPNLMNTVWEGSETLPGYGRLRFEFLSPTVVRMIDAKTSAMGKWRILGRSVTLDFGGCVYSGMLLNTSINGTARDGQGAWTWNVSKSDGAAPAPVPREGFASFGSGSLVDRAQRLVVTNVHVVMDSPNVKVRFPLFDGKSEVIAQRDAYRGSQGVPGKVVMKEERADLALVQLDFLPEKVVPLPLSASKAKPGQQVHSVGNPGASKALWIYSPGKVRQVFPDHWSIHDDLVGRDLHYNAMKLETDSPINPGDSGGPLVNDACQLVGVAHASNLAATNFSYFIETSEVRALVEKYYRSIGQVAGQ